MGKKKKNGMILALIMTLILSLLPVTVFAGGQEAANAPVGGTAVYAAETKNAVQAEHRNYLFIGNSLTHYNNRPVMFRELVKAGTGKEVSVTALTYSNRTQTEHANAIAAVFRTKGDITQLTEAEKQYFYVPGQTYYAEEVYRGYADRLWDYKAQKPIRYDTVILQSFYREGMGDIGPKFADAVASIIRTMNSPSTTYVVEATMGTFDAGLDGFLQKQDVIDRDTKEAVKNAKNVAARYYADVKISWYGRALCNYFCTYGETYAQAVEPAAYMLYSTQPKGKGVINDLIYGDFLHPTQLGTYIAAATLYSALYGDPQKAAAGYPGSVHEIDVRVDGVRIDGMLNIASKYNGGNGLKCQRLTETAASIATRTQLEGAVLQAGSGQGMVAETPVLDTITNVVQGVRLTWKSASGAVLYRIFRKIPGYTDWTPVDTAVNTTFTDKTVKSGVSYTYTVRCLDIMQTTFTSGYDEKGKTIRYIAVPQLTSASSGKDGVTVKWQASIGAVKYRVYRKEAGAEKWTKMLGTTTGTSFTDKTAVPGTDYIYMVRCVNSANTEFTSAYDVNGIAARYVKAPMLSGTNNVDGGVRVMWETSEGAEKYRVYRKEAGAEKWTKMLGVTTKNYFTDKTAVSGTDYVYTVRCVNNTNTEFTSAYDTNGIRTTYVEVPTLVSLKKTAKGVTLTWKASKGAGEYRVVRKAEGTDRWTTVADTRNTSWTDTTAKAGVTYVYSVRCLNEAKNGWLSAYDAVGLSITP